MSEPQKAPYWQFRPTREEIMRLLEFWHKYDNGTNRAFTLTGYGSLRPQIMGPIKEIALIRHHYPMLSDEIVDAFDDWAIFAQWCDGCKIVVRNWRHYGLIMWMWLLDNKYCRHPGVSALHVWDVVE